MTWRSSKLSVSIFPDTESLEHAFAKDGTELLGRNLRVGYCSAKEGINLTQCTTGLLHVTADTIGSDMMHCTSRRQRALGASRKVADHFVLLT